ncbi:hypothetical protein CFIMG_007945RA00001 [Ceratocystis fimbriata CBS 114723]|uniref:Uncharacterized protein n=1 Tax=Ceratocystis fimbriata CBS 114723 TaxID=1035309 RepID=A0A2C5WCV7_9PEZI|nr:hypothetical protein CFIMG_007945RA00001 [Ceratocystis fimbriata CBS 114723]
MANFMNFMAMFQKFAMKAEPESEPETENNPVHNPKELTVAQLKKNDWSFSIPKTGGADDVREYHDPSRSSIRSQKTRGGLQGTKAIRQQSSHKAFAIPVCEQEF